MATTIDWPSSLPQVFQQQGFSHTPQSGIIETNTSTGYKKRRRRFTGIENFYSGTMIMSNSEYLTFKTFVEVTTFQGALSFNFPDQLTAVPTANMVESRFVINGQPYRASPDGDTADWAVSFGVEVLP